METLFEILKYTLPSLVVVLVTWVVLRKSLVEEKYRRNFELRKQFANQLTPTRLRAYERLTLFLERTKPEAILLRCNNISTMNAAALQQKMLELVRDEFGHNVTQQLYVSDDAWVRVVTAKESLIQLINRCSAHFQPTDKAFDLAQMLIQTYVSSGETPTDLALAFLKSELSTNN